MWGSNSRPGDQELHGLTETARCPWSFFFFLNNYSKLCVRSPLIFAECCHFKSPVPFSNTMTMMNKINDIFAPFLTAAKKSRVVSDADDSDSDVISDKSGKREKTLASDSEEEVGKEELSDKKNEEKDLFGSDSESGNEEE